MRSSEEPIFQTGHDGKPCQIEKVRDVVGLYLDPPGRSAVLCVDEGTEIQALNRYQPILPTVTGGTPEQMSHDDVRSGT